MAALSTTQPQIMTNSARHRHDSTQKLIDSIEFDQIVVPDTKSWKNLFAYIGPGFLVAMAFIDPGNFQTDLQSGAQYRYELLWVILLASCAALLIQYLAANLGVVTGKHLAEHCRKEYPKVPNFLLWVLAEIAIIACDIPEVIGTAFALNMLFKIPLWGGVLITGLSTLVLLFLQHYGVRKLEILVALFIFTIAGCFCAELGFAKPKSSEVLKGFIPKLKGDGATKLAISLLGAMVMPHNLFLHSALVLSRKIPRSVNGLNEACRYYLVETGIAAAVALIITACIISVSGVVCNSTNLSADDSENCKDLDLNKASFLLEHVLGDWSSKVFAVALLASGLSSAVTGTCAGQYVMQGFLDIRMKPWIRNLLTRCLAIVPSLIVSIIGGSAGAGDLIIFASMILSFELPFALIPLLKFTSSKTKMGSHANSKLISVSTWIVGSLIMGINIYFLGETIVTSLHNSHMKMGGKVVYGILGFSGMSMYLGCIGYLVSRKIMEGRHLLALSASQDSANISNTPRQDIVNLQLPQQRTASDVE